MSISHKLENFFGLVSILLIIGLGYAINQLGAAGNDKDAFHDGAVLSISLIVAACICAAITMLLRRHNAAPKFLPNKKPAIKGKK